MPCRDGSVGRMAVGHAPPPLLNAIYGFAMRQASRARAAMQLDQEATVSLLPLGSAREVDQARRELRMRNTFQRRRDRVEKTLERFGRERERLSFREGFDLHTNLEWLTWSQTD